MISRICAALFALLVLTTPSLAAADPPAGAVSEAPAPPCKNGAADCKPWERDWSNTRLQPGSIFTAQGTIVPPQPHPMQDFLYNWQTLITGGLAILAALIGGGLATRAARRRTVVMDKTLKFLVAGAAIAATVAAYCVISNYINTARHQQKIASLESSIAALEAKCASESEESTKSGKGWGHDPLVCDPKTLSSYAGSPLVGIQKDLSEKQKEIDVEHQYYPMELPYLIALGVVVIAGLPWSWYFLLRRIREVSDAIVGRES